MRDYKKKVKRMVLILLFTGIYFFNVASVHALSIVVHVPEKYTDVEAGERFYFELGIKYPENPSRKDLRLNYEIKRDGEIVAQSKVLKAVETQASFMDYIVVPESAKSGLHIINIVISDYEFLREEVSASFHVVGNKAAQMKMYFFVILGAIAFVGLLVVFQIFVIRRKSTFKRNHD